MKYIVLLSILTFWILSSEAQMTIIPDTSFEKALINLGYDTEPIDGAIYTDSISGIKRLFVQSKNIKSLEGIEDFKNLEELICGSNKIEILDISKNILLKELNVIGNNISSLNLTNHTLLERLICNNNFLSELDVSQNSLLGYLSCDSNFIESLEVHNNPHLYSLSCTDNQLEHIDISMNTKIFQFYCSKNDLTSIDISQNNEIVVLGCSNNKLSTLDFSGHDKILVLSCSFNEITELNLENLSSLSSLNCRNNALKCLNVANGNNSEIVTFTAINNPSLNCINVDNSDWSTTHWTSIDSTTNFSNNCNQNCISSTGNTSSNNEIIIYPNPSKGLITINSNYSAPIKELIILNSDGRIVLQKDNISKNILQFELDEPAGLYLLLIKELSGLTKYIRLIKS